MAEINEITKSTIGCAFRVSNGLGSGFLEKVYENALAHEIRKSGHHVEQQAKIHVYYDGIIVGEYVADLLVAGIVLLEIKAVQALADAHIAQCLNYLAATRLPICLLMNFGTPKVQIRRLVK